MYVTNRVPTGNSSPRTRGYFRAKDRCAERFRLFPAHAGVFPVAASTYGLANALPRARGGISRSWQLAARLIPSSPRTRGYFRLGTAIPTLLYLFPAHAGVFPLRRPHRLSLCALPRARGGISGLAKLQGVWPNSSPRTRGYFRLHGPRDRQSLLFPAHAGVFPWTIGAHFRCGALPRARGGISELHAVPLFAVLSSPRTRGYFRLPARRSCRGRLFPAHAGVFPRNRQARTTHSALPRARGGISVYVTNRVPTGNSSPRTRGYFLMRYLLTTRLPLFPAHAGVFPL